LEDLALEGHVEDALEEGVLEQDLQAVLGEDFAANWYYLG
jgi:hypothetical protein